VALATNTRCTEMTKEERTRLQAVLTKNIGITPAHEIPVPATIAKALADPVHGPAWKDATLREIRTLHDHGVFETGVIPEPGARPITTRWVYKAQADGKGLTPQTHLPIPSDSFSQSPHAAN